MALPPAFAKNFLQFGFQLRNFLAKLQLPLRFLFHPFYFRGFLEHFKKYFRDLMMVFGLIFY